MVAWGLESMLQLQDSTGIDGFTLQDATPVILSWTAPDDGQLHRAIVFGSIDIASTATGGSVNVSGQAPDGSQVSEVMFSSGLTAGLHWPNFPYPVIVGAGTTVTLVQSGALTAGAAVLWAEIWGR